VTDDDMAIVAKAGGLAMPQDGRIRHRSRGVFIQADRRTLGWAVRAACPLK